MRKYLLFFICAFMFSILNRTTWGQQIYQEEFHQICQIKKGGSLNIINRTGNVSIIKWNKNYIDVSVVKKSDKAKEIEEADVEIIEDNDVSIKTVFIFPEKVRVNVVVNYEIKVPADIKGIYVYNLAGNIRINDVFPDFLKLECISGNIRLDISNENKDVISKVTAGNIDAYLQQDLNANLLVTVQQGEIINNGILIKSSEISDTYIKGTFGKGGCKINMKATRGKINLYKL